MTSPENQARPESAAADEPAESPTTFIAALTQERGRERFAFMLVMSVAAAMVLPYLGSVGFFDPWETHYAEVAREMAERDDYLYPFWKEAHFFSKPILLFWLTAPLYALAGLGSETGELSWITEWLGRLPVAFFSLGMIAVAFQVSKRLWNLRAAVFGSIAASTIPYFGMTSRQAIPDTLYVAPMTAAMLICAWLILSDETDRKRLEQARIPRWFIVLFGACLLPQMWEIGRTAAFLNRVTLLGSEFNTRVGASLFLCAAAMAFLFVLRRFGRDPYLLLAALLLGLATLGKGPHAVVFVLMAFFFYFAASGEWLRLKRPTLILAAVVYFAVVSPWVIVMLLYEGVNANHKTWFQRFVLHDLFGRLGGVHGERGGIEYYTRYLSFGVFQWAPVSLVAVISALTRGLPTLRDNRRPSDRFTIFVAMWTMSLFIFFTFIGTKFHHYIYPAAIPAALLAGWWLDDLLRSRKLQLPVLVIGLLGVAMVARDLTVEPWQWADLFTYHYVGYKPDYYFPDDIIFQYQQLKLTAWQIGIAVLGGLAVIGPVLGMAWDAQNRNRKTSSRFDYILGTERNPQAGFVMGMLASAVLVGILTVQWYWVEISQHWTHRQILHTYWEMREPGEPLISYQMDWKGETFYSHNTDRQIRKSQADLRRALKVPGRAFVIVQQDRYPRLKKAVGKKNEDTIQIVDRSNAKWFLVLIEDAADVSKDTEEKPAQKNPQDKPAEVDAPKTEKPSVP